MAQNSEMVQAPDTTSANRPALGRILGRPFGVDEAGHPIDHGSGKQIVGAIDALREIVGAAAIAALPATASIAEREAAAATAGDQAVDRLVSMLNEAVEDSRYHVTREYLLSETNQYSYEFRLFVYEYCRVISGHGEFFRRAGSRSIPRTLGLLIRPLGIQRTYAVLPQLMAKFVKTDLRMVSTTRESARIRWYGAAQATLVPEPYRIAYIRYACQAYQGGIGVIPSAVFGLEPAEMRELTCQADGAEYCEWEITWHDTRIRGGLWKIAAGLAGSAALGLAAVAGAPAAPVLAGAAILPLGVGWHAFRTGRLGAAQRRAQQLLIEQRDLAEIEFDRSEHALAELQVTNLELIKRVSELTALHEVAQALRGSLKLDDLLQASLVAVLGHLGYDRAMVMLADEKRGVLTRARAVGGTVEMSDRLSRLELPLDFSVSQLVQIYHADQPLKFDDVDQDPHEGNRALALALGVTSFLGTPLISQGRRLGLIAVDNASSGRPIDADSGDLLFTAGSQVAGAVESARLYEEIETHNRTLEERVAVRTSELAAAVAEVERELAERRRAEEALSRQQEELTALHETALGLAAEVDVEELLRRIVRAVHEATGFDRATIFLPTVDGKRLRAAAWAGIDLGPDDTMEFPLDGGVPFLTRAYRGGEEILVDGDQPIPEEMRVPAAFSHARLIRARGFVCLPLVSRGHCLGVLTADNATSHRPLGPTLAPLRSFSASAAVALENARLYRQLQAEFAAEKRLRDLEREYLAQVNKVVAAAAAVESGDFDPAALDETAGRGDALGQLARTFRGMAVNVIDRERRLRAEVRELRIEIDGARQAREIAEITGTDYFQRLRSEARDLRRLVGDDLAAAAVGPSDQ